MKTILVVDDNEQNRLLLHDVLSYNGFSVLLAGDGAEGVALARAQHPDLILMDIQMPVMNGLEAGKALRADPLTSGIRMLALSSFNPLQEGDEFFATGFDGYIDKPVDIRTLSEIITRNLPVEPAP
jgi:two-component system cell cycle response regulator DivK